MQTRGLSPEFRDLLLKCPVDYAPSIPVDAPAACGFSSSRLADFLPWHCAQETLTTCSAATAAIILNAIHRAPNGDRWTAMRVLDAERLGDWARRTRDLTCEGLTLSQFEGHLRDVLGRSEAGAVRTEIFFARGTKEVVATKAAALLEELEAIPHSFLLANFNQRFFLQDGFDVGHFSVVGGYDASRNCVAVLDVDIRGLRPYWVPFDVFCTGISTFDAAADEHRGLLAVRLDR